MSKMTITRTFKADEEFDNYLGLLARQLSDYSISEIIRQSVLIAGPFLLEHPQCGKSIGIPHKNQ
jgi:hypothetical protein